LYRKIDHLGIAVSSLEEALSLYQRAFGLHATAIEEVAGQSARVAMLPVGESRIELLEATSPHSQIAKFLSKRGEGIHHVCFEVDDIREELARLRAAGVRLVHETPRLGAEGSLVAFVHPSGTKGVLVELKQRAKSKNTK
jgi:methylmalonyl-CoA epimerase